MDYESIFFEYEEQYTIKNNIRLKKVIDNFVKKVDIDIEEVKTIYSVSENEILGLYCCLKDYLYYRYPSYLPCLYYFLKKSNFKIYYDYLDAILLLGENVNGYLEDDLKKFVLHSPFIDDIRYENGLIFLKINNGKEYSFYSTKDYFKNNSSVQYILKDKDFLVGNCHNASWKIIKHLGNVSLITELLPYYFEGTFYHSVVRDENGMIIDLANNAVYSEEIRKKLYHGRIICETKKGYLDEKLEKAIRNSFQEDITDSFNEPLLLALCKQAQKRK